MQASPNLDGLGCWRAAIRERFRPHLPDCGLFAQGEDKPARRVPSDMHPHFVQKSKMPFGVSQQVVPQPICQKFGQLGWQTSATLFARRHW